MDEEVLRYNGSGDPVPGVKIVKVTASVTFEAYVVDAGHLLPHSIEERISDAIGNAVGIRAPSGSEIEEGDTLIAMTSRPDFAVDVFNVSVYDVDRRIEMDHVIEMAEGTTGMW